MNWSRRSFLSSRGLGVSVGGMFGALMADDQPTSADPDRTVGYWSIARRAMGCEFSVLIPPRGVDAVAAGESALDEIEELEELLTIFSSTSATSYLNQHAANRPVRVDNRLYQLLKRSAELTRQTDGAFDISAGALVRAWGFVLGPRRVPTEHERLDALSRSGIQYLEFDDNQRIVRYNRPGLEINFGSIGKGYAIDRAIQRIREEFKIECALIQGGTSSMYGLGSPGDDRRGWLVAVKDPLQPGKRIATVRLRDKALGTSSNTNQYFEHNGRHYGHVLDPRSGLPVDELASVSVLADDAATADALATALFVMGLDKAADFCHNQPNIAVLLVLQPGPAGRNSESPRILTFNLPPEDVNLSPG